MRYLGPAAASHRAAVLDAAHALLHLIDFDEPFGFGVVEANGVRHAGHRPPRGSMRESPDSTMSAGFTLPGVHEAVQAVDRAGTLDRVAIRATTVDRFARAAMVERYVAVYRAMLASRS